MGTSEAAAAAPSPPPAAAPERPPDCWPSPDELCCGAASGPDADGSPVDEAPDAAGDAASGIGEVLALAPLLSALAPVALSPVPPPAAVGEPVSSLVTPPV